MTRSAAPLAEIDWIEIETEGVHVRTAAAAVTREPPGAAAARRTLAWLDDNGAPPMWGTDLVVRRVLFLPFDVAAPVLADVLASRRAARSHGASAIVATGHGHVTIDPDPLAVDPSFVEVRRPGHARPHWVAHPLAIDLVLTPWSSWQSELRLQPHGRRRAPRLPRHYFDLAHPALTTLRDEIEGRSPRA